MFRFFRFKKLTVPETNNTKEVDAIDLFYVEWTSRHGEMSFDIQPEVEAFTTREAADGFADSLRKAFALVRHTCNHHVKVTKRPQK
jgi:hypothetical protein